MTRTKNMQAEIAVASTRAAATAASESDFTTRAGAGYALALALATGCATVPAQAEHPAVLGVWADAAAALGGFALFFLAHYVAHRIAHSRFWKVLYDAHDGHHRTYSGKDVER